LCRIFKNEEMNKRYFKFILTILCLLGAVGSGFAQNKIPGSKISGTVLDEEKKPLDFATISLLKSGDSSLVRTAVSDLDGKFLLSDLSAGDYFLTASMIGFKKTSTKAFSINQANPLMNFPEIIVAKDSKMLGEVTVRAIKPFVERKMDRLVVNVENSITSAGSTALEVLEKSPGINVDRQNNAISMSGKGGVQVMINGKQSRMPMEAAVEMLKSMSSDNIKRIELITTPPSKYDADGDAGIINIVLKKNDDFGTNGSFTLGAGMASREKLEASVNLNHHVEKVNYFGTYSVTYNNTR